MWKAPNRPKHEITQPFNDGIVKIYSVEDTAKPGYMPVSKPVYKTQLRFAERYLGIQRYYSGLQNQIKIERILRVPRRNDVSTQDIAVTHDGKQYRIENIQPALDVYPASMDLTLTKVEQAYEVPK